jgi:hypothetical protein
MKNLTTGTNMQNGNLIRYNVSGRRVAQLWLLCGFHEVFGSFGFRVAILLRKIQVCEQMG